MTGEQLAGGVVLAGAALTLATLLGFVDDRTIQTNPRRPRAWKRPAPRAGRWLTPASEYAEADAEYERLTEENEAAWDAMDANPTRAAVAAYNRSVVRLKAAEARALLAQKRPEVRALLSKKRGRRRNPKPRHLGEALARSRARIARLRARESAFDDAWERMNLRDIDSDGYLSKRDNNRAFALFQAKDRARLAIERERRKQRAIVAAAEEKYDAERRHRPIKKNAGRRLAA